MKDVNLKDRYYLFETTTWENTGGLQDVYRTSNNLKALKRFFDERIKALECNNAANILLEIYDRIEGEVILDKITKPK